jgi:DNA replication and repair protein RecF
MYVAAMALADFRNYRQVQVAMAAGPNVIVGANGQGKTNLIEALGYLATLSSHRVAVDAPMIRVDARAAVIRATVVSPLRTCSIELELAQGRANRAQVNRSPVTSPRDVLGILRAVIFAPEDLALVKGDPAERRSFLDRLLALRAPRYLAIRSDYDRIVRQRTALLKTAGAARRAGRTDVRTLDVWDQQLAQVGAELLAGRLRMVALLQAPVESAYQDVSGQQGPTDLSYRSSLGDDLVTDITGDPDFGRQQLADRLLLATSERRSQELDRGTCLVGPHRDDLTLGLRGLPAKGYASHGECWSFALALRLASYQILRDEGDGDPVLILDDVFAELDAGRRSRLAELVAGAEQVLVTAAVADDVPAAMQGKRLRVAAGQVHDD